MKKIIYIFFLLISVLNFAQGETNPFEKGEKENSAFRSNIEQRNEHDVPTTQNNSGGNPADPAPIDDYIPLLVIAAVGIIIYTAQKKKKLLS